MEKKKQPLIDRDTRYTIFQPAGCDIRVIAQKQGQNISDFIRTAILDYIERNQLSAD